jgi:hypothetical protein
MVVECGSYDEGIADLRKDIAQNLPLAKNLRTDLQSALNDEDYSWKNAFIESQCEALYNADETEEEVRSYAKKILWDALFAA